MSMEDPHDLVDRLLTLHPPSNHGVAQDMDRLRWGFIHLGHMIATITKQTPEQAIAIRKLHEACMAAIAAIACNQEETANAQPQEGLSNDDRERLAQSFERGFAGN